ncbi:ABC transporter ATP-binding protein [Embleya sp. NBC_00896]|uniref:ABC transporter ATP-binding protein n=1 Tax=Embleya sp. NBC_00896 TaxID=2975961 RepID=UPI00386DB4DD|nr:ATP-binding cassette domain-containing protein [Embleya sp. NBC_00896]
MPDPVAPRRRATTPDPVPRSGLVPPAVRGPEPAPATASAQLREPVLSARDIRVDFGGVRAVDAVSVDVYRGEVVGVIGPNGSGKTTLLNAITGVVPASGELYVGGVPVRLGSPERARRAGLVRMFQTPQPVRALTCVENVLLATSDTRHRGLLAAWLLRPLMARVEQERLAGAQAALDRVGLGDRAELSAGVLTYGEQRLLDIARGIAAVPRVLMLDEPSAGLNSRETDALLLLLRAVAADGVGLLVVDHKIDFIDALCDRITVLETGRVVAEGVPAAVWRDRRVMDAYLGVAHDG